MRERPYIVLFDGACNLCNGWVSFIRKRDTRHQFSFVALQEAMPDSHAAYSTVVLLHYSNQFEKSEAAIRILTALGGRWQMAKILLWLPRCLRDAVYDWVAANRHRWFKRSHDCSF